MKILIVHNNYFEKGGEDYVFESDVEMLKKFGHEVICYKRSNEEIKELTTLQKIRFFLKDIIWSERTFSEIKALVKKEKPDIAHLHNIFLMVSPSVYEALKAEGIPVVQSLCNYRLFCPNGIFYRNGSICQACKAGNFMPAIMHRCLRNSFLISLFWSRMLKYHYKRKTFFDKIDAYVVLSEFSRSKFIELGLPEEKIFVKPVFINRGVEKEEIHKDDYALFIGRLADYKGVYTLISAYEKLPQFHIKIMGDGPLYKELARNTKRFSNIELLGSLSADRKLAYIKKSRFIIFPSECYETFGGVITEAFACGIPVIAARLGTRIELIEDGKTGLHFTPQDTEDLASKISWAYENPEEMKEMGRQARKECEIKYTQERNYEILKGIYGKVLESYGYEKR